MLEKRLNKEAPELSARVRDCTYVLTRMLDHYLRRFPSFTDHSLLHSLTVLESCNQIIGREQVKKLGTLECYVLIMSCYLHDIGMGISEGELEKYSKEIDFGDYFMNHPRDNEAQAVRDFHNELSGVFINKFADFLEIPSPELTQAISRVARGHRKTDLFDDEKYGIIKTQGQILRINYLSAVLRLADEIDVASDRNPELLFDTSNITDERSILAFGTHESISRVDVTAYEIVLIVDYKSSEYVEPVEKLKDKIQATLDYCREVAEKKSDLTIWQKTVRIKKAGAQTRDMNFSGK